MLQPHRSGADTRLPSPTLPHPALPQNPEAYTEVDPGLSDRAEYGRDKQQEFGTYRWISPRDTQVHRPNTGTMEGRGALPCPPPTAQACSWALP